MGLVEIPIPNGGAFTRNLDEWVSSASANGEIDGIARVSVSRMKPDSEHLTSEFGTTQVYGVKLSGLRYVT